MTDRQTDTTEIIYTPLRGWSIKIINENRILLLLEIETMSYISRSVNQSVNQSIQKVLTEIRGQHCTNNNRFFLRFWRDFLVQNVELKSGPGRT